MAGKQAKILSEDHVEELLLFAQLSRYPARNRLIVLLSVRAGLRARRWVRLEQVNDDAISLEVPKQIRTLELAAGRLQDVLLGFHLARDFDLREVGLVF
jgi:hypothetical protein